MVTTLLRSKILLLIFASILAMVAFVACAAEEATEPVQPEAAAAPADPAAPQAPGGAPSAPQAAMAADTPLPAQAAADPDAPKAAEQTTGGPSGSTGQRHGTRRGGPRSARVRRTRYDRRAGCGARWPRGVTAAVTGPFSTQVFGPPFLIDQKGNVLSVDRDGDHRPTRRSRSGP